MTDAALASQKNSMRAARKTRVLSTRIVSSEGWARSIDIGIIAATRWVAGSSISASCWQHRSTFGTPIGLPASFGPLGRKLSLWRAW